MRRFPLLVLLLVLLFPLAARPVSAAPLAAQDCATQQSNLASLGRPMPEARLIGSANPVYTTPAANSSDQPPPVTHTVQTGETLSIIARQYQTTVAAILTANNIPNPNVIYRGQKLVIPGAGNATVNTPAVAAKLPAPFAEAWLVGEAWQGEAATLWLKAEPGTRVTGALGTQRIPFRESCGLLWGMVSFDVFDAPGTHTVFLTAQTINGSVRTTALPLTLRQVGYPRGPLVVYPPDRQVLLAPETVRAENEWLNTLFAERPESGSLWDRPFRKPIDSVITQVFGSTGTRNGVPVSYHEGVDLRAREPLPFYASARGVVIVAEPLTVRGNVIYLDHGAGVITGYFHLSRMDVNVGDMVEAGQLLGLTGNTGLSTAPHLHWEMRVNGRWVNPMPWLTRTP